MLTVFYLLPLSTALRGLSVPVRVTDGGGEAVRSCRWGHRVILDGAGRVTLPALTCSLT